MKLYAVIEFDFARTDGADMLEEDCRRFVTESTLAWWRNRAPQVVPENEPYRLVNMGLGLERLLPFSIPTPAEVQALADRLTRERAGAPEPDPE